MVNAVIFSGILVLGVIASVSAFRARKYPISETKDFLKFYSLAVAIMSFGFILHTAAELIATMNNNVVLEHMIESIAHVILFIAFLSFVNASSKILKSAKQFWFG
ncbi:MAG TPA: hypothetical protein HA362_02840 [Nanoarchaeota archaeon]|nr:hypothetical protein [Nanoarchaeota archaeon]